MRCTAFLETLFILCMLSVNRMLVQLKPRIENGRDTAAPSPASIPAGNALVAGAGPKPAGRVCGGLRPKRHGPAAVAPGYAICGPHWSRPFPTTFRYRMPRRTKAPSPCWNNSRTLYTPQPPALKVFRRNADAALETILPVRDRDPFVPGLGGDSGCQESAKQAQL